MNEKILRTKNFRSILYAGLIVLLCAFMAIPASAAPTIPDEFWGEITIGGEPAPAGTEITAKVNWNECGSITTNNVGSYGTTGNYGVRLEVKADENCIGKTITFWVKDVQADQEIAYKGGISKCLDLTFPCSGGPSPDPTPAPVAGGDATFDIPEVTENGGGTVTVNTQTEGDVVVEKKDDGIRIKYNDEAGWDEVIIHTEGEPTENPDNTITGKVSGVTAKTKPVNGQVNGVGSVSTEIKLSTTEMPASDAEIRTNICEKADESATNAFILAAKTSSDKKPDIAYVMNVNKKKIDSDSGSDILTEACLKMTIDSQWVSEHGGRDAIVILRRGDNGGDAVRLETDYMGTSGSNDIFQAKTKKLCVFAVVGVTTVKPVNPPHHGGGGGSSHVVATTTPEEVETPEPTVTETVKPDVTETNTIDTVVPTTQTPSPSEGNETPDEQNTQNTSSFLQIILGGLLVLALAGGVFYYYNNNKK